MTTFEIDLTADDLTEDVEEVGLELDADEVVTTPVAVPVEWDHALLINRDKADSHPMEAVTGLVDLKARVDTMEDGAQANIIETVAVNDVPLSVEKKRVNIPVPTSYGWTLDLDEDGVIYLKDKAGGVLSSIDTGLERVVKSGYYDEDKVEIVLVLDDDSEIRISASALVDVYTADGYYLTVSKERVFDFTENAKQVLKNSTAHIANTSNPHKVTKAQVGLGNVDNTSDAKKPISEATQTALDLKADADDLALHVGSTSNPHKVTKAQVGLGNVDNTADLAKPISVAQQAALDLKAEKASTEAHIANTSNPHKVTKAQVGLGNVDNTSDADKPVSTATKAELDKKADKTSIKTYTAGDAINISSAGVITATGSFKKNNLQMITSQNYPNLSFYKADKTYVGGVQTNIAVDEDGNIGDPTSTTLRIKKGDTTHSIAITVNPTPRGIAPTVSYSSAPSDTIMTKANIVDALTAAAAPLTAHKSDTSNPHKVTKAQVGLGNVDNTADADKPVSTAQQTALDGKVDKTTGKGLSTEDFTTALRTKLDDLYTKAELDGKFAGIVQWSVSVVSSLPTEGQANTIYLVPKTGDGNDTHDEYLWIDGAWELVGSTQIQVDVVNGTTGITVAGQSLQTATEAHPGLMTVAQVQALASKAEASALTAHTGSRSNPHGVTKAQVGLGNVDNTSDMAKPISTAMQEALDLKADASTLSGYVPTTRTVNGKALSADIALTAADVGALSADTYIPEGSVVDPDFSETSVNPVQNKIITNRLKELAEKSDLTAHTSSTSNPHAVTKAQVGLGNVDNTSDADKPVSTATKKALDAKASSADLSTHTGDTSNPHKVTKAQVGLGNVDNTADKDKPISTATQTALDKKALATDLTAHTGRTDNPHGVTKAQIGLGNVTNTSDADKPVSTAQQTALDKKVDKATGKGLSSNDFTDAQKTKLDELYTKTQIDSLVAGVAWATQVVDSLPTTGQARTIYFVPKTGDGSDTHDEYIWVDGAWELIGSTQVTIEPASSTQDGLMTKQHVQKLEATASGLATAQSDISAIQTEQTTQDGRIDGLESDLGTKVDKVTGKGLSSNDFTSTLLTKLNGIATGAQVNVIEKITVNGTAQTIASKTVALTVSKSTVGLGNVDNTSDANKPISTATQTALNKKGTLFRGTFTGDGATKTFTLTHGIGAMPAVTLYKGSALMITDTEVTTTTVKFTFNTAPASGTTFTAVLIG